MYRWSWQAENRAQEAERTVSKLQKEVDRLEGRVWNPSPVCAALFSLPSMLCRRIGRWCKLCRVPETACAERWCSNTRCCWPFCYQWLIAWPPWVFWLGYRNRCQALVGNMIFLSVTLKKEVWHSCLRIIRWAGIWNPNRVPLCSLLSNLLLVVGWL